MKHEDTLTHPHALPNGTNSLIPPTRTHAHACKPRTLTHTCDPALLPPSQTHASQTAPAALQTGAAQKCDLQVSVADQGFALRATSATVQSSGKAVGDSACFQLESNAARGSAGTACDPATAPCCDPAVAALQDIYIKPGGYSLKPS